MKYGRKIVKKVFMGKINNNFTNTGVTAGVCALKYFSETHFGKSELFFCLTFLRFVSLYFSQKLFTKITMHYLSIAYD